MTPVVKSDISMKLPDMVNRLTFGQEGVKAVAAVILGLVSELMQLWQLMVGVGFSKKGGIRPLFLVLQFFCPMAGLGLCALVDKNGLASCGCVMAFVLICGAAARFIFERMRKKE